MAKDWTDPKYQTSKLKKGQRAPRAPKPITPVIKYRPLTCQYCDLPYHDCRCGILLPFNLMVLTQELKESKLDEKGKEPYPVKILKLVEDELKVNQRSREDDRYLMLRIWYREGFRLTEEQRGVFMSVSSPESIRRTRQKLQENGDYLASKEVQEKRRELEQQTRLEMI